MRSDSLSKGLLASSFKSPFAEFPLEAHAKGTFQLPIGSRCFHWEVSASLLAPLACTLRKFRVRQRIQLFRLSRRKKQTIRSICWPPFELRPPVAILPYVISFTVGRLICIKNPPLIVQFFHTTNLWQWDRRPTVQPWTISTEACRALVVRAIPSLPAMKESTIPRTRSPILNRSFGGPFAFGSPTAVD